MHNPEYFPIKTDTACKLKWTWSTLFLTTGETASCHRCNAHTFDFDKFDFHNTPEKIKSRQLMLEGKWPGLGCEYCKNIEDSGGISDRLTSLKLPGVNVPKELADNTQATNVTPTILEVYFSNACNQKCLYCSERFSSLWVDENRKYDKVTFRRHNDFKQNKDKVFKWLKEYGKDLKQFHFLGGEPFFQKEFLELLDLLDKHPTPSLKLSVFSNLNVEHSKLKGIIETVTKLIATKKIKQFEVTASLDCWGEPAEYVRYPLDLKLWEQNFKFLLGKKYINLIINSTLTPLTIKTYPDLLEKFNEWYKERPIYLYQNSVNWPNNQKIDIFGDIFEQDFIKALNLKPTNSPEEIASKEYLDGIRKQSKSSGPSKEQITDLFNFLNEIDYRRGLSWRKTFPWLVNEFKKYNLE